MSPCRRLAHDERGSMLALFAVFAFALLLVAAFVIDVGNWQEHRRHLQVQVDNGARSTGIWFTNCFQDAVGSNANIRREARKYAGDPLFETTFPGNGTPYNLQVDDPDRVVLNLNRPEWPPLTTPGLFGDDYQADYDLDPEVDGVQNEPCASKTLLVRAKDQDVPTFFGGVVPGPSQLVDVRAKARVEIDKVIVMKGFLPWAVPEIRPKTIAALIVNESQADPVPTLDVINPQTQPPTSIFLNNEQVDVYTTTDLGVGGGGTDYGVVIALSTREYQDTDFLGQTLSYICSRPAVVCYTGATGSSGLDFIHGWPKNMGTGPYGTVALEQIELVNVSGCDDSSPYFQWVPGCQFRLRAEIDPASFAPSDLQVKIQGPGCPGQGCDLTFDGSSGTDWFESPVLSLNDGSGRNQYDMTWKSGNGNCNTPPPYCGGTTKISVPFAATDEPADPGFVAGIRYVNVKHSATGLNANSLGPGSHTLKVDIGIQPPLRVESNEFLPPILLRFASKSGSLNQALDCDHAPLNLDDEVRDGCQTYYARNQRDLTCGPPAPTWTSSNLPPSTFIPASGDLNDAPDCIAAKTGDVTAMAKGLHERFEVPSCPENKWIEFRNAFLNEQPLPNDRRYVTLIVTNFGAFSGAGSQVVPVEFHAGFYVTGWFTQQSAVGCPGENDPPPPPACQWPAPGTYDPTQPPPVDTSDPDCNPAHNNNKGNVWGYFVTTVLPVPGGIVSHERCEFGELGTCAARLVE